LIDKHLEKYGILINMYRVASSHFRGSQGATKKRVPCPDSLTYDAEHFLKYENRCKNMHTMFHWEGEISNTIGLIGDSICKWSNNLPHMEIQAVPGLTLGDTLSKLEAHVFKLAPFHAIMLHVGTNDVMGYTPEEVGLQMEDRKSVV
jgi:hypothetical protein